MVTPRFSIVIAAHDAAPTIASALRSALHQSDPDLEVIVVDDGSRDRTVSVVQEFVEADPRVRLIRCDRNAGPSAARNLGIVDARGEWIAILDADDAFQPTRLASLARIGQASGAVLVADNLRFVDAGGAPLTTAIPTAGLALFAWIPPAKFVRRNLFNGRGFRFGYLKPILRRRFLVEHGIRYREDLRLAEDYHLYLDCMMRGGGFVLTPAALYDYTQSAGSLSRALERSDVERLLHANDAVLGSVTDGELRAALRERDADLRATLAHMRFVDLMKERRPVGALALLGAHPAVVPIALTSGRETVTKRLRRLARRSGAVEPAPSDATSPGT
jgi:succinoglycan biosynthesis protein ExoO